MEQRLNASYLRAGLIERAGAVGIVAVGIGVAVLLGAWGVSLLWRYTPPEIAVRVANPEVRVTQDGPLTVTQDKPFTIAPPAPLKIDAGNLIDRLVQIPPAAPTASGNVISREVTVFSTVSHSLGEVITGWRYQDGSGRKPFSEYCYYYYTDPRLNGTSTKVDIASNGVRRPNIGAGLVPDLEGALAKCQWWRG
jgi:hypothetical protein